MKTSFLDARRGEAQRKHFVEERRKSAPGKLTRLDAGGQTPLYRRLPKLVGRPPGPGHSYEEFALIKLGHLAEAAPNSEVDYASLQARGGVGICTAPRRCRFLGARRGRRLVEF